MLAVCLLALASEVTAPIRHEVSVSIDAPAGTTSVAHTAVVAGTLRAWVESAAFDPVITALDESGARLAEDDDGGGRPTPWIDLPVVPGQVLNFVVRSKAGTGAARIVTVELAETEACRTAAADLRAQSAEALARLATSAARESRADLAAIAQELCVHDGLATSDALQAALEALTEDLVGAGDHPGVLAASERLIAVQRDTLPPDSSRRLSAVVRHSSELGQLGRPDEGIAALSDAVAILRRTEAPNGRVRRGAETALGSLLYASGDMRGAMERWDAALGGFDPDSAADARGAAQLRANLAVGAFYLGDLGRARAYIERARAQSAGLVPGSPLDQQLRNTLSAIVTEQGDFQAGRVLAEESFSLARASYPAGHVEVAIAELNLALARVRAGENAAARDVLTRILADPPPELAPDHALIVQGRLNLAAVELRLGAAESAERRLAALAEQFAGKLPATNALMRAILRNRSIALVALGRLDEAAKVDADLLAATREALPPDHPERLRVEFQGAGTDALLGRYAQARASADDTTRELLGMLASRALILSPREAEATARSSNVVIDFALALLLDPRLAAIHPGAESLAFELGETARGLGIAASRSLRGAETGGVAALDLRESARQAQMELVRAARGGDAGALQQAIERRDAAERALRERLASSASPPRPISAAAVASRLAPDEIAVSWHVCQHDRPGAGLGAEAEPILIAFLVRHDAPVAWIDLGAVAEIESAGRAWRAELERAPADRAAARSAGQRLRALVVDPIRARAPAARRWFVAPDGPLLSLPLDALPEASEGDALLGDSLTLRTVWSFDAGEVRSARPGGGSLVALGDPEFGGPSGGVRARWAQLAATGREIDAVASIWKATHADEAHVIVLRGADASARSLVERAPAARWLHVATHGAFDADDARGSLLTTGGDDLSQDFGRSVRALVPLVRCELVLAGANADPDATFTAEELGALDLRGCELAVLSACDTGRGEIIAGQGVASFQRALVAAGARGSVTSLWRVPDEATRELMSVFYRGLWEQGLAPAEALWRAKSALRARRAPPRDWAAWVLASPFGD